MSRDDERFEKLVSGYLDENLAEGELDELALALESDPERLDSFVARAVLEAHLVRRGETAAAMETPGRDRFWGSGKRREWLESVAVAAAIVVLGALLLYRIQLTDKAPFATLRESPFAKVMVSGQPGDVEEGTLRKGSTLTVTQGSAEIRLDGARCLLQSPGTLKLVDTRQVHLLQGKARFAVEEKAHGFRVTGKYLDVVDLGTDFGVDLSVPDQPQVHVIKGEVEVRSLGGRKERTRLREGNALALAAAGSLQSIPLDAKRFPGELPKGIPAVRFSFDQRKGNVLPASGSLAAQVGAHVALDHDLAPDLVPGRFGQALRFNRDGSYAQTNWMGIGGTQVRTIALWIRTEGPGAPQPCTILGWGEWTGPSKMSHLGLRLSGGANGATLRIVSGRRWLQGVTPLNDGRWHHVVVCMGEYSRRTWPETKMFIDGQREDLTPRLPEDLDAAPIDSFFTEVHRHGSTPLIFGRFFDPAERQELPSLRGQLDEVIIAPGLLTDEQVRALHDGRLVDSGLDLGR